MIPPSEIAAFLELHGNIGTVSQFMECFRRAQDVYTRLKDERGRYERNPDQNHDRNQRR